mgnify:CR=1 FL=1
MKVREIPVKCLYCGQTIGEVECAISPFANVIWSICDTCRNLPYSKRIERAKEVR